MPNFLKSLFKPSPSRRSRRPGALPPDVHFTPPTGHAALSSDELSALTQMLQDRLTDGHGGERHSVLEAIRQHPQGGEDTMRQLTAVLKGTTLSRDTLIPSQSPRFSRPNADHRPLDVGSRTRRARRSRRLDPWAEAVEACSAALGELSISSSQTDTQLWQRSYVTQSWPGRMSSGLCLPASAVSWKRRRTSCSTFGRMQRVTACLR
jgi:hypothetical protein